MTKSFITATAFAALIGFAASGAMAQQSAPSLDAPAIQKSAPVESGKSGAASGTVQNKSGTTMKQGATAPLDGKAKRDAAAVKPADSKAKREAAQTCGTIKDKAAHDACLNAHAKNQPTKTPAAGTVNQKAAAPEKAKPVTPRVGG